MPHSDWTSRRREGSHLSLSVPTLCWWTSQRRHHISHSFCASLLSLLIVGKTAAFSCFSFTKWHPRKWLSTQTAHTHEDKLKHAAPGLIQRGSMTTQCTNCMRKDISSKGCITIHSEHTQTVFIGLSSTPLDELKQLQIWSRQEEIVLFTAVCADGRPASWPLTNLSDNGGGDSIQTS